MKLGEPHQRTPRMRSGEVLEGEHELTPWQQVERWARVEQPKVLSQALEVKGNWSYILIAHYAVDVYPEHLADLQPAKTDWSVYQRERYTTLRHAQAKEFILGAIKFFPQDEVYVILKFQSEVGAAEFSEIGEAGFQTMQVAAFLTIVRPERKAEWTKHLARSKTRAWEQVQQQPKMVNQVNDAATFVLAYPDMREQVQDMITKRWTEVSASLPELKRAELHELVRFLRNLKVILARQVDMSRIGSLNIQPPAGTVNENRSSLPERPNI